MKNTLLSFMLVLIACMSGPSLWGQVCTGAQSASAAATSFNNQTMGTVARGETYTFCIVSGSNNTSLQLAYNPVGTANAGSVTVMATASQRPNGSPGATATLTAQSSQTFGVGNNDVYEVSIFINPLATATSFTFTIAEVSGMNITRSNFTANIPLLPLPVELSSFTATSNGKHVLLNWSTAFETDNQGFEVERSQDGTNWSTLSFVESAAQGATGAEYAYQDRQPVTGTYFYRLRQLDYDGTFALSELVSVAVGATENRAVYPNPTNGQLWLPSFQAEGGTLRIFDLRGSLLREQSITPGAPVDVSELKAGTYALSLITGDEVSTQRFVKQ